MQPDRALRALQAATADQRPDGLAVHDLTDHVPVVRYPADHDLATPASDTILIGAGEATRGCSTCASTVSFGPKACMRPSRSTRIWSTASIPIGRCATTTTMAPRSRAE